MLMHQYRPVQYGTLDADGDGFAHSDTLESCESPGTGYTKEVLPATDCDDTNALISLETLWYFDVDQDGLADALPMNSCGSPGFGYTNKVLPLASEFTKKGTIIYPNPTEDVVTILLEKTYKEILVKVFTIDRKQVFEKSWGTTDKITFELVNQKTGLYFLQVMSKGKSIGFYKVIRL